jgi:orotate phosphoribosyltransferase-like protein
MLLSKYIVNPLAKMKKALIKQKLLLYMPRKFRKEEAV